MLVYAFGVHRDSVRFDYRVLDEEGDPVVLVFEYSLDGERWRWGYRCWCSKLGFRYSFNIEEQW